MGDIVELGNHESTVASVISRLVRHEDRISHITVILDWDDGSTDIYGDDKSNADICWHSMLLSKKTQNTI
jgi:hypothetical protein